jgi:1-acyl-sn-glycerol-3-phosphate acyltransferase
MYVIEVSWGRALIKVIGCKVTVSGTENIPRTGGLCFVGNHGGAFDIVLFLAYSRRLIGFIAKKELLFLPFFNLWIYMLGGLFIDRKNPRKALQTINKGVERIKAGGAMIVFPEGHRSRGQGLLPFHPGSLKLATQSEAVIVPVALSGTYDIFERNYRVNAVPVSISFCKPVNTADIPLANRKQILADKLFAAIKEELEKG